MFRVLASYQIANGARAQRASDLAGSVSFPAPWLWQPDVRAGKAPHHSATDPSCRNTRAIGFDPPNGYLANASSLRSNPSPGFSGSGYFPFTIRIAGKPNHSSQILSRGC